MNRRTFLRRVTTGVVATAALVSLPASIIKAAPALAESARYWACERLLKAHRAWVEANHRQPAAMVVGSDLYDLYEVELVPTMRFMSTAAPYQHLLFKGAVVVPRGRGYGVEVYASLDPNRGSDAWT